MVSSILKVSLNLLVAVLFLTLVTFAIGDPITPGDARKGRYVFRKCVACHKKNQTPVICPGDRTVVQWDGYFTNDLEKCRKIRTENNFEKYRFTSVQLGHLLGFLHKYGKDTGEKFTLCN